MYWFRTPPDVRVGRLALDPAAIRSIEDSNPHLKFDWGKILKVKPPPPPPDYGRDRGKRGRRGRGADANTPPGLDASPSTAEVAPLDPEAPSDPEHSDLASKEPAPAPAIAGWDETDPGEPARSTAGRPHLVLELTDEQGLARLRARHAEIQARISERIRDPARLEDLRAQAARLDPDGWRTVEEARERLASLDDATGALRKLLGRRRRTRRGGARRRRRPEESGEESRAASSSAPAASSAAVSEAQPTQPTQSPGDAGSDPYNE